MTRAAYRREGLWGLWFQWDNYRGGGRVEVAGGGS